MYLIDKRGCLSSVSSCVARMVDNNGSRPPVSRLRSSISKSRLVVIASSKVPRNKWLLTLMYGSPDSRSYIHIVLDTSKSKESS